jgi:uncharacterized repeat protein (TIGR01451 family)
VRRIPAGLILPGADGLIHHVVPSVSIDHPNYFTVTSYDASGVESAFSNEIMLVTTATPTGTASAVTPTQPPSSPPTATAAALYISTAAVTATAPSSPTPTGTRVSTVTPPTPPSSTLTQPPTRTMTPTATPASGPNLAITTTHVGTFRVGRNGTYTIKVSNLGAGPTTGPIVVTDQLPDGLSPVSWSGARWTCEGAAQTVTCTNPGPLRPQAKRKSTLRLKVLVAAAAYPAVTNTARVSTPGDTDSDNKIAVNATAVGR